MKAAATIATWTTNCEGRCDGLSAIAAEYRAASDSRRPELWLATAAGKILRWGAGAPIASLPRKIVAIAVRDGAILAQTDKRDVYLLDATTGKQRALWQQGHVSATLGVVTPLGGDAIVTVIDQHGHPTDRCARVFRVGAGNAAEAGVQIAIRQGENIVYSYDAVYAETEPGQPARIPLDGSPPAPISNAEIFSLLLADDPPGWRVHSDAKGLRIVRPGATETVLLGAEIPVGLCFLDGALGSDLGSALGGMLGSALGSAPDTGRWLATLSLSGTLALWDTESGHQVATTQVEPRSQLVRQGGSVVVAGPTGTLRWWAPTA